MGDWFPRAKFGKRTTGADRGFEIKQIKSDNMSAKKMSYPENIFLLLPLKGKARDYIEFDIYMEIAFGS